MSAIAVSSAREPKSIVVTLLTPIGDALLATPALHLLRKRFPYAKITVITYPECVGILEGNRDVHRVLTVKPKKKPGADWAQTARVFRSLRAEDFDLALHFSTLGQILSTVLPVRRHVGFPMQPFWWLKRSQDQKALKRHAIDRYLEVLAPLGIALPTSPRERIPRLALLPGDRVKPAAILQQAGITPGDVVVSIHPGGEGFDGRKQWPPERFASVASALIAQYQAKIVLLGGKQDVPLAEKIASLLPGAPVITAGKLNLKETAALIQASTLFIGNDSAPLHLAAAVGTPAIGIFGPSNIEQFRPVGRPGSRLVIAHSNLPCSPCFNFVGSHPLWHVNHCQTRACLKAISAEDILAAATHLLDTPASS